MQLHMVEENYLKDVEIISAGDVCENIIFVVSGKIEIEVHGETTCEVIDTLKMGDVIGFKSIANTSIFRI